MKKCISCGKDIENDSDFCFYCGTAQNTTSNEESKSEISYFNTTGDHENIVNQADESTTSLVTKTKREDDLKKVEDDVDHLEVAIQESEKRNKRKKQTIIIAVIASILVITSITVSIVLSNKRIEKDREERIAQRNSVSTEAKEIVESSSGVNGKGYYHFENDFNTTISSLATSVPAVR